MEWQQLIGFYQVCKLGNLTKAADATFRTRSALSQQISALERELSCTLFERGGKRGLKLTTAGERFFQFTRRIMTEHKNLLNDIKEIGKSGLGQLRMAVQPTPLYYVLPEVIQSYRTLFPLVDVFIVERTPFEAMDLVKQGEIDMAIVSASSALPDLMTIKFKKLNNFLIVPMDHPLGRVKKITFGEIAKYPLILSPYYPRSTHHYLVKIFEQLGVPYHVSMDVGNLTLACRYVEMGVGITFCSTWYDLHTFLSNRVRLIPIDHIIIPDHVAFVLRKDKRLPQFQAAFMKMVFQKAARTGSVRKHFLKEIAQITDLDPSSQISVLT